LLTLENGSLVGDTGSSAPTPEGDAQ